MIQRSGVFLITKLGLILDSIKFEHTVFALPYAYIAMILAADGTPTLHDFVWITIAMGAARTLAMSANRLIDRHIDAENPRTASRHLPAGIIKVNDMVAISLVSVAVFFVSAYQLNPLCVILAPVAVLIVVIYPYTKRFTWACHFILGFADGIAPAGAWIAVTGSLSWEAVLIAFAVATWIGGFDILYSCQDYEFDIEKGLYSLPQRFGVYNAMKFAKIMHVFTIISFVLLGAWLSLAFPYYIGCVGASALLIYEHRLVSPTDLSKINLAFFNINGYIAIILFICTVVSVYM